MTELTFQEMILRLLEYWQAQGCLVQQPYNVQVGAGTMNPATALRVLGPEPWNVVYVEPSVRPDDGRFGDNPNRMQMHHQLQVILKPDPGNPQELFLESLETIGFDRRHHDIRFVEDNWEAPALGAWGLGWEVWLDGQEITQFTYFQQAGGQALDPVSVEITYGLDRIALALQAVGSVWELDYGAGIPYGDILLQSEIEHCRYYFDVADVDAIKVVYDTYEKEAWRCIEAGLVLPAHDYNLKCSHLFNILDSRGVIGVTERANYFRRMRDTARRVSELYLEQRQRLEYPFLEVWSNEEQAIAAPEFQLVQTARPQTFLLEIGSEELPVDDLTSALNQLRSRVPELLRDQRLAYERVEVSGTPRRLAVLVHQIAGRQADLDTEMRGPPVDRAFDAEGNPTKAAIGFARGANVKPEDLRIIEEGNKRYVAAVVREEGRPTAAVLAEVLPDLIADLKFERSMRWNSSGVTFSRPLRWIVALFGPDLIPFSYAGVSSGRASRGLRPLGSPEIVIEDGATYAATMRRHGIITDLERRKEKIWDIAAKLAAEKSGTLAADPELLQEVANLVERPTPLRGRFDARFLGLPKEVLVAVMRKHQRYFPVYAESGRLLPYFIAVRNGDEKHLDVVIEGNEHVIKARFADAEFFYNHDSQRSLYDLSSDLKTLTFQSDLGSMSDKVHRLVKLTPAIGRLVGLTEPEIDTAVQAATLSKADLSSKMVVEMTSLQGTMGGIYARLSGESEEVAAAIAEQYDAVSRTRPGLALAVADRLDSLVGLFAVDLAPRGSNDPYALRRAALHVIENLIANEIPFDLRVGLAEAAAHLPVQCDAGVQKEVLDFIDRRLETLFRESGHAASIVKAVLAEQGHNPYSAQNAVVALSEATQEEDWEQILDAYARCVRITRGVATRFTLKPADLMLEAEKGLLSAYQDAADAADGTVNTLVASLRQMVPAITVFFDEVLVMDERTEVRENRLALLQHIAGLTKGIADLSHLEGF